ncbi:MAG: hypothetical protein M1817_002830 [Caeruleum heppii]|nr:MAG: hypothetical protein M1817_002830 [Caeruleum heppii]
MPRKTLQQGIQASKTISRQAYLPPLMRMPLEIREQIYGEVFAALPRATVGLLQTCRRLYTEAQPSLFKRSLPFTSQHDLLDWIRHVGPDHLHHVRSIRVNLANVISSSQLNELSLRSPDCRSSSPISRLYEQELQRLSTAFQLLPNIQDMTICKQRNCHGDLVGRFYENALALLARYYPRLQSLAFYVDQVSLEVVSSLRQLRRLRFTGYSTCSPQQTCKVLQSLPQLEQLELFGPPPDLPFQQRAGYTGQYVGQSVTPDVVRRLRPLKSFTVCEIRDPLSDEDEVFFQEDMLLALLEAHSRSLRKLVISTDFQPSEETSESLAKLLSASSLRHLDLGWPAMHSSILEPLPSTLHKLQLTVHPSLTAEAIGKYIYVEEDFFQYLSSITFRIDGRRACPPQLLANTRETIRRLKSVGIAAFVDTWHPVISKASFAT